MDDLDGNNYASYEHQPMAPTSTILPPSPRIRGVVRDILLAFAVSALPLIIFSCLLLGLVYGYRIIPNGPVAPSLGSESSEIDNNAIYVNISATTLTTVASWSSTVAPLVLPFILALVSFPVTRTMIRASRDSNWPRHPSPYQLALMLRILCNASLGSVWRCITYIFRWHKKRAPMTTPLAVMTWILILGSVLSLLVFATDTWLHFTTKAVSLTQFQPTTFNNASLGLFQNCTDVTKSFSDQCTLNPAATATFAYNSEPALQLLANISSMGMVQQIDVLGNRYAYLGLPPNSFDADKDYTATSLAVHSQCSPITSRCIDKASGAGISGPGAKYKCDFAMEGFISTTQTNTMTITYFTDSTLSNNSTTQISMPNPYYFAAVVSVNQNLGWHQDLISDPEMANGLHGSTLFVLLCNATVLDWKYTSVNGVITKDSSQTSNSSTTNVIMGTQGYTQIGDPYILQRTSLDVWQSHTAQEVANKFAYSYSQTALAAAGGAFVPMPAVEAQSRSQILVAKVPKAPLACLLLSNLLLALLGIILTITAFLALSGDVGDVQARLSIDALVAAHFETSRGELAVKEIDDMFEERQGFNGPRVRVERTALGGWRLASYSRC